MNLIKDAHLELNVYEMNNPIHRMLRLFNLKSGTRVAPDPSHPVLLHAHRHLVMGVLQELLRLLIARLLHTALRTHDSSSAKC